MVRWGALLVSVCQREKEARSSLGIRRRSAVRPCRRTIAPMRDAARPVVGLLGKAAIVPHERGDREERDRPAPTATRAARARQTAAAASDTRPGWHHPRCLGNTARTKAEAGARPASRPRCVRRSFRSGPGTTARDEPAMERASCRRPSRARRSFERSVPTARAVTVHTTSTLCTVLETRRNPRSPSIRRTSAARRQDAEEAEETGHHHARRVAGDQLKNAAPMHAPQIHREKQGIEHAGDRIQRDREDGAEHQGGGELRARDRARRNRQRSENGRVARLERQGVPHHQRGQRAHRDRRRNEEKAIRQCAQRRRPRQLDERRQVLRST